MTVEFDYDSIDTGYYDLIYQRRQGAQSKWHHLKFHTVNPYLAGAQKHLDVGCGPGTFIGQLPQDDLRLSIGVDIASAQVNYANKKYGCPGRDFQLIEASGYLPFADEEFDVVSSIEVIEHLTVEQTHLMLSEAWRVLKPGGHIIVTTPNYHSHWPLLEWFLNRFTPLDHGDQHINKFYKKRLVDLFDELMFVDIRVDSFQILAPFMAFLSWGLADVTDRIEKSLFYPHCGSLLLGRATKQRGY